MELRLKSGRRQMFLERRRGSFAEVALYKINR